MFLTTSESESTRRTHWQARLPFFFGWVIVGVVFLRSFTTAGAIWSTSVMSVPMTEDLGWSHSAIFLGITLRTLGAAVGGFFLGRFLDTQRGAPILAVGSAFVSGFGLMLVAAVQEVWQFWLIYGLLSGLLGAGPGALLTGAIVPKWFVKKRGRATALASMGTGLAAFLLPFTVANVVEAVDWRTTFLLLGGMTLVFAVLPALLIKTRPEDVGLHTDGDSEATAAAARARGADDSLTAREAFRTFTLWLLVGAAFFASFSPTSYPANLTPTFSDKGFDLTTAGFAFSAYGFTSFFGRFFWGWLADRVHIRKALLIICVWNGLTVPLLFLLPGNSVLTAGAIAGFGIGGWVGLNQVVWATYFGRANLGAITGRVRPLITLSGGTGPFLVAAMADFFGGFGVGIMVMALSWWASSFFLFVVRPVRRPATTAAADAISARNATETSQNQGG